jgi:hypothetical protein
MINYRVFFSLFLSLMYFCRILLVFFFQNTHTRIQISVYGHIASCARECMVYRVDGLFDLHIYTYLRTYTLLIITFFFYFSLHIYIFLFLLSVVVDMMLLLIVYWCVRDTKTRHIIPRLIICLFFSFFSYIYIFLPMINLPYSALDNLHAYSIENWVYFCNIIVLQANKLWIVIIFYHTC